MTMISEMRMKMTSWKKLALVMIINLQSKGALKKNDTPSNLKANNKNASSKQPSTDKAPEKEKEKEKEKEEEKEKETTPEIVKEKEVTPSQTPINLDLNQKIFGDLKLDYGRRLEKDES